MIDWRYVIAGFCIPLNVIFIIMGILIGDPFAIMLGIISTGFVSLPLIRDFYGQKEKENEEQEEEIWSQTKQASP